MPISVKVTILLATLATALFSLRTAAFAGDPITCTGHKALCEQRAKSQHVTTVESCRKRFNTCMETGIWRNAKGDPFKSFRN
jgi:hypothetical protein